MPRMIMSKANQTGVTLIELLVGLAVGTIVLAGVAFSWSMAVQNNSYILGVTAMNNDMRAIMQLITQDVRRATATGSGPAVTIDGDCIIFDAHISSQDIDDGVPLSYAAGTLVPSGYRFNENRLQMWFSNPPATPTCSASTNWQDIFVNGDRGVNINDFTLSNNGSWCLDLDVFDPGNPLFDADEAGTCVGKTGNLVELLMVNINLAGSVSIGASNREFNFSDSVKVRNDRVLDQTVVNP